MKPYMKNKKIFILLTLLLLGSALFGQFNIDKFSNPQKYGWSNLKERLDAREDLFKRQKLLQIYEMKKIPLWKNMLQSGIMPGWGQFNTHSYTKGQVFLYVEVVLVGTSYYFFDQSNEKYNLYKNATYIEDINQYYDDASKYRGYAHGLIALSGLVWIYNIYDTYISTEEYNSEIWNGIINEFLNDKIEVSLYPLGFEVRF